MSSSGGRLLLLTALLLATLSLVNANLVGLTSVRCNLDPAKGDITDSCGSLHDAVCGGKYCKCPPNTHEDPALKLCVPGAPKVKPSSGVDLFDDLPFDYVPPGDRNAGGGGGAVQPQPPQPKPGPQPGPPVAPAPQPGFNNPNQPQPGQPGYPNPAQPGYPNPAQPGYPNPAQPGYPNPAQPGYPNQPGPGYNPNQPGVNPNQPGAYNPNQPGISGGKKKTGSTSVCSSKKIPTACKRKGGLCQDKKKTCKGHFTKDCGTDCICCISKTGTSKTSNDGIGEEAGGGIGGVLALGLVGGIIYFCCCRGEKGKENRQKFQGMKFGGNNSNNQNVPMQQPDGTMESQITQQDPNFASQHTYVPPGGEEQPAPPPVQPGGYAPVPQQPGYVPPPQPGYGPPQPGYGPPQPGYGPPPQGYAPGYAPPPQQPGYAPPQGYPGQQPPPAYTQQYQPTA